MTRFPGRQIFWPGAGSVLKATLLPQTSSWVARASLADPRIGLVAGCLPSQVRNAHNGTPHNTHFAPPTHFNASPNVFTKREPETITPWCRHVVRFVRISTCRSRSSVCPMTECHVRRYTLTYSYRTSTCKASTKKKRFDRLARKSCLE